MPKGKVVSVCESSLSLNKICNRNSLSFSLSTKGKVKGIPVANFVRAQETHTDRQLFPWARSPGNDKHISKMKNN